MSKLPLNANWIMKRASGNRGVIRHSMRLALSIVLVVACVLPAGCIFKVSDNISPFAPAIAVYPSRPDTTDDLHCLIISPSMDPDGDTVTYSYGWYKDGTLQPELTSDSVNSEYTAGGEVWRVGVTGSDGITGSATGLDELTISDEVSIGGGGTYNSPPTAPVVKVTPELPATADDQLCSIVTPSTDSDGDAVTYTYQWYKDGVLQDSLSTNKVDSSYTAGNQVWKCVVTASDGMDSSDASFASVIIQNSAPYSPVVAITPSAPISTDDLVCNIETQSSDLDGDDLTYSYQWYKDDVLQEGLTTNKVDSSYTAEHQVWECVVTASDGIDSSAASFDQVAIVSDVVDVFVAAYDSSQADKDQADFVCDGTNDQVEIQDAIDALPGEGGMVAFSEGTYIIEGYFTLTDNVTIAGSPGATTFDCSGIADGVIRFSNEGGYANNSSALAANVSSGDTTVSVYDASSYTSGDYIKLYDDTAINGFNNGEIVRITGKEGDILSVNRDIVHDYTQAKNGAVRLLTICQNVTIDGIEFIGPGIDTEYHLTTAYMQKNLRVMNCKVSDFGRVAFLLIDSLDCSFIDNEFENIYLAGTGYSICLGNACEQIVIENNSFTKLGRHYIATGGATGDNCEGGWPRDIFIINNYFEDSSEEAVNTHPPFWGPITVTGNTFVDCDKGVELCNAFGIIENNTFVRCVMGIHLLGGEEREYTICENVFEYCDPYAAYIDADNVTVEDNTILGSGQIYYM